MGEGISRSNQSNYSHPVGFGYITIPSGVDRDMYIKTCYRKERVSIQLDDGGGVIQNCYISRPAIREILFPEEPDQMGSCVAFIVPKHYNIPIITEVISKADETQLLEEYSFKKEVHSKMANVSVEGRGKSGELFINVDSSNVGEGNIFITLRGKDNTAKFSVKCFGEINLYSEGKTSVKALNTVNIQKVKIENGEEIINSEMSLTDEGFEMRDKTGNSISSNTEGEINLTPKSIFNVFKGEQLSPIPLGDVLKAELEVLSKRLSDVVKVLEDSKMAASGGAPAYAAAIDAGLKLITSVEDFTGINSEKSFTA